MFQFFIIADVEWMILILSSDIITDVEWMVLILSSDFWHLRMIFWPSTLELVLRQILLIGIKPESLIVRSVADFNTDFNVDFWTVADFIVDSPIALKRRWFQHGFVHLKDADSRPRFETQRILPDHVPEYSIKYWRNTIRQMGIWNWFFTYCLVQPRGG